MILGLNCLFSLNVTELLMRPARTVKEITAKRPPTM